MNAAHVNADFVKMSLALSKRIHRSNQLDVFNSFFIVREDRWSKAAHRLRAASKAKVGP